MACFHPLRAWRTQHGEVVLAKEPPDAHQLRLPCGNCLGCRMANAQAWALRCQLELQQHNSAVFTTLTYDDKHLPPTLQKRDLQLWLKRLRKAKRQATTGPLRFFASGEYGEQTTRPHYHAILYGTYPTEDTTINDTWGLGHTKTVAVTPAAIAYVAGYSSKKIGYRKDTQHERVDPETGEVYTWQPPFLQMSRRPGIGAAARQWADSWRIQAIHNGVRIPVPRYLHEAWKQQATTLELEQLEQEKYELTKTNSKNNTEYTIQAKEKIAINKQAERARNRKL